MGVADQVILAVIFPRLYLGGTGFRCCFIQPHQVNDRYRHTLYNSLKYLLTESYLMT
jgi:hypothetical protein